MDKKESGSVQVLDRTLDIVELLSTERNGLGVTEISKRTGLNKSTAYRILATLLSRGYVDKTPEGRYTVGPTLIGIVSYHINELELQTESRPVLQELSSRYQLIAHLGVIDGSSVVYIEKIDPMERVKNYNKIGYRVPAHSSSLGKCLMAGLSDNMLKSYTFERYTANTITDADKFRAYLKKVKTQGWAIDNQEQTLGTRCIAAPVYDYRGEMIAAVSGSGNTQQIPDEKIMEIAEAVKQAAAEISKKLGYSG